MHLMSFTHLFEQVLSALGFKGSLRYTDESFFNMCPAVHLFATCVAQFICFARVICIAQVICFLSKRVTSLKKRKKKKTGKTSMLITNMFTHVQAFEKTIPYLSNFKN